MCGREEGILNINAFKVDDFKNQLAKECEDVLRGHP